MIYYVFLGLKIFVIFFLYIYYYADLLDISEGKNYYTDFIDYIDMFFGCFIF